MCGINGFNWPDNAIIQKMNETIKHRGPDGEGVYTDGRISLGHRRLSIIDLSEKGRQPMSNEDGTVWLVYNGEIYNFQELRPSLEKAGHVFRSRTDSEVIIHAYEEWGEACLSRFNGMFAFAIYDSNKRRLFLARDRFGIKPLLYFADKDRLIFSSEIKAILCHDIERKPDDRSVADFLYYSLSQHNERTFFHGISRLLPGHYLTYDLENREVKIRRWYELPSKPMDSGLTREALVAQVRELFRDSIRLRLVADVPVGSCLSGGIDSTAIVCTMRQLLPDNEINTFSSVFPGEKVDESRYIDEVCRVARVESFKTRPTDERLLGHLNDLVYTQEEPFLGPSIYAQYTVMNLARENHTKVLLDGQGGDELFGGYNYFFGMYFYELLRKFKWLRLMQEVFGYWQGTHETAQFIKLATLFLPGMKNLPILKNRHRWINEDLRREFSGGNQIMTKVRGAKTLNDLLRVVLLDTVLPRLLTWEDRNSMRWSVETRLPFLDYRLVELATSMPAELKLRRGITKVTFREAVADALPDMVRNRKDKLGFAVPESVWLKSPAVMGVIQDMIASESFRQRPYWHWQEVEKCVADCIKGNRLWLMDYQATVWKWLSLEMWLRAFIDR